MEICQQHSGAQSVPRKVRENLPNIDKANICNSDKLKLLFVGLLIACFHLPETFSLKKISRPYLKPYWKEGIKKATQILKIHVGVSGYNMEDLEEK